jgi:beta-lactamase superfamily II metal-dependent hydrolase
MESFKIIVDNQFSITLTTSEPSRFFRLRVPGLTTIRTSSPLNGEEGVAVSRETVVTFSAPLSSSTALTTASFYAGYGGRRILLCGDIAELAERELLKRNDLQADVLVLPHHGSVVPQTRAFVNAVNPQYCIRSSSQHDVETRNGLLPLVANRGYFNTADDGAVTVTVTPRSLSVSAFKSR